MNVPNAFEQTSVRAARAFLQTVVVVDNCAGFGREDIVPSDLVAPDDFATGPTVPALQSATAGSTDGPLDAMTLSRAFACRKLVCAILKPSTEDRMEEAVRNASHRADLLVLDWQMNDDGELAASIIDGVLQDDGAEGRLRLIAVYTSQSPLSRVADSLAARVPRLLRNGLTFQVGSTRVVMLSKGGGANAPEEAGQAVEEADLPDRLLHEFASLAQGLLSNATMAAIGGIRDHTHRMLARFGPRMDGPLLTHRALLQSAADADEFAADLIMAELQAQVPIRRIVSHFLGVERIREYMDHRAAGGLKPQLVLNKGDTPATFELDAGQASELVEKGLDALDAIMPDMAKKVGGKSNDDAVGKFRRGMKDALHERLYLLFSGDLADARRAHSEFAVRSKIWRDATALPAGWVPRLRPGSIVKNADEVWLCITPRCDSIRIPTGGGDFLFAVLSRPSAASFDLMVPDGTDYRRLELAKKRTRLITLNLVPDANGDVVAVKVDDHFRFTVKATAGQPAETLQWLAELKPMHAQRLVQRYASNLSRIGVDDFEWHRLQMPGGLDA